MSDVPESQGEHRVPPATTDERPADPLLRLLVSVANEHGVHLSVTLSVGGMLVSGMLVGNSHYFEGISTMLRTASADEQMSRVRDVIADSFGKVGEQLRPRQASTDAAESANSERGPSPSHIHLRDARFYGGPGNLVPLLNNEEGAWWRGRLEAVDGWFLGSFPPS